MINMKFSKKKLFLNFYLLIFFSSQLFINSKGLEHESNTLTKDEVSAYKENYLREENKSKLDPNYLNNLGKENFYILGPGDKFFLRLSEISDADVPVLDNIFEIDADGIATLPRLRRVKVSGLTILELTQLLNQEYSRFLKDVDVSITIKGYRPINIYLDGEVKNPGLHVLLKKKSKGSLDVNSGNRIFDALKVAGGVSLKADLSSIEITRINSISNGGGRIKTKVDLLSTLDLKDTTQNISLRDGDTIFVPYNNDFQSSGFSKILKSNINPKFINVYISGRVKEPGIKEILNSSSLVDSIKIAGGAKIVKGKIRFLRYNNDGSVDSREFRLNNNAKRGTYKNPYLANGDVIFVGDSFLSITNEVLNEFTDPLRGILSAYSFFKIIND